MAKVHPDPVHQRNVDSNASSSSSSQSENSRRMFTVWMKSLVFHSNGCTVFNSDGQLVYRVDNYQQNWCKEVFLMDSKGQVLFSAKRKRVGIFGSSWEGYKWDVEAKTIPWFKVERRSKSMVLMKDRCYRVSVQGLNRNNCYKMSGNLRGKKPGVKITDDVSGQVLAEVEEKEACGDDVKRLMVEPGVDSSLVMALFLVFAFDQ